MYSFIDILAKTQQEMRFSNHAKVYIESALLKMIHLDARSVQADGNQAVDSGLAQKVAELERTIAELQQQMSSGAGMQATYRNKLHNRGKMHRNHRRHLKFQQVESMKY